MLTAYDMGTNAVPEFHTSAESGIWRYFQHNALDQTDKNFMVEFVVPSLSHTRRENCSSQDQQVDGPCMQQAGR